MPDDIHKRSPGISRFMKVIASGSLLSAFLVAGFWLATASSNDESMKLGAVERDVDDTVVADDGYDQTSSSGASASIRRFVGLVQPGVTVAVVAPMSGNITELEAPDFGVLVEKGDRLVTLDLGDEAEKSFRESRIALIEAKSELLKLENWATSLDMREVERAVQYAEREHQRAKTRHDRTKQLLDDGIVSAEEYQGDVERLHLAEQQRESAINRREEMEGQATGELFEITKERFEIAKAEFDSLKISQSDRDVRAPISGVMLPAPSTQFSLSKLSIGQSVDRGMSLFLVGNLEEIIVATSVSEFDIDLIEIGQKAIMTSPSQSDFRAVGDVVSISQISSSFGNEFADMGGGYTPPPSRYDVVVKVSNDETKILGKVRIGMTVDVEIDTNAEVVTHWSGNS